MRLNLSDLASLKMDLEGLLAVRIEHTRLDIEDFRHLEDIGMVGMTLGFGVVALSHILGFAIVGGGVIVFLFFGFMKHFAEKRLLKLVALSQSPDDLRQPKEQPPPNDEEREIEDLLSQIAALTAKKSDKTTDGEIERPQYVNDNIKALELHGRILYLTMKKQVASLDVISKSSKRVERSTNTLVALTMIFIGSTFYLSIVDRLNFTSPLLVLVSLMAALGVLLAFGYTAIWLVRKLSQNHTK